MQRWSRLGGEARVGLRLNHPCQDGNGRAHRYLIHHILAQLVYQSAGRRIAGVALSAIASTTIAGT
jgi:hypothetical protein